MSNVNAELEAALQALRESIPSVGPSVHTGQDVYYSKDLAVQIAALYAEGRSLYSISQMSGMPAYATLQDWAKYKTEFREALSAMREIRALHFEDAAIAAAESAGHPADVPAARLKAETYWKAAEVNDPARYGKKVTHAGDASNPIKIVVHTGWTEPLNEFQKSPELGADGLIIRPPQPVIEVKAEPQKEEAKDEQREPPRTESAGQATDRGDSNVQPRSDARVGPSDVICSSDDVYSERSPALPPKL